MLSCSGTQCTTPEGWDVVQQRHQWVRIPPCWKHMVVQLKTGGAADAVADRTPASFSWKAFENRSAVSSLEFRGFDLTFLRTPQWCRHSFLGLRSLSESFFSQNWFCFAEKSGCFSLACPIQTNRSEFCFVLRYRRSNALARHLALAQSASNQGVVGWHRWRAVRHGACLSRRARSRSVVSYPSCSSSTGMPAYAAGRHKPLARSSLRKLSSLKPFQNFIHWFHSRLDYIPLMRYGISAPFGATITNTVIPNLNYFGAFERF